MTSNSDSICPADLGLCHYKNQLVIEIKYDFFLFQHAKKGNCLRKLIKNPKVEMYLSKSSVEGILLF